MGFYQTGKMAVCIRSCLLIFFLMSLVILYFSYQGLFWKKTDLIKNSSIENLYPIDLKMDYWVQKSRQFHLRILRFRPHPAGGFEMWFQGQYYNFVAFMNLLMTENPRINCRRIMLEQKSEDLMIHMEVVI